MNIKAENSRKRRTAAVDFFKTVMIYILTASMLIFAGQYINERQNAGQRAEIPEEKRRLFEIEGGTAPAAVSVNENPIYPIQITMTSENNSFTAIYNNKIISDIYDTYIKYGIRSLFNKNSECRLTEKEEGDELWKQCTEKENSVYIKYAGNYIYPIIYTFLEKPWDIGNAADAFSKLASVHELFIINGETVYGVARDAYGNVSVYTPEPETGNIIKDYINKRNLQTYNSIAGVFPGEFLKGGDISAKTGVNKNNIKNLAFPEHFYLFYNHNIYSKVLRFSNPIADENNKINTDASYVKDLFKTFDFNAESSRRHSDESGITFVNGKNTVKFYNNGQILYNYKPSDINITGAVLNESGGIHLSKFLRYDAVTYTFYEKIKAANISVGSLAREITGNEADIYLKDIKSDSQDNLTVSFSYYYEGIEIKLNGYDEGITVTINENSITEFKINSLYVTSQNTVKNINPILILNGLDSMISNDLHDKYGEMAEIGDILKSKEETAGKIAEKYKLEYDKIQDKFIVNEFELVYNIYYTDVNNGSVKTSWEIR